MKIIKMVRDFDVHIGRMVTVAYVGGRIYQRVPEYQARIILEAGAGTVVESAASGGNDSRG